MTKKKIETKPSLLQRMFGALSGDSDDELKQAWADNEIRMPRESSKVNRVMNMGPIFKKLNPDAYAVTGPLKTIALNRELIKKDKQNIDDVLTHELTHVGQGIGGFLRKVYQPDEVEREAINKEAMKKKITKDIVLPNERKRYVSQKVQVR